LKISGVYFKGIRKVLLAPMPANKYALLRYRIIDRCLRNTAHPYPSKELLRTACDEALYQSFGERVSISTIEKDIYAMRFEEHLGYHAPIAYHKLRRGYYYTEQDYSLEQMPITHEEAEAIRLAAATLNQFSELELFEPFGNALDKIMQRIQMGPQTGSDDIKSAIEFERLPRHRGTQYLSLFYQAILQKQRVKFDYSSRHSQTESERSVIPLLLKEYRHLWYLIGFEPETNRIKTFALYRMNEPIALARWEQEIPAFDKSSFFKYSVGITASAASPEKVRIRCDAAVRDFIFLVPLHHSQVLVKDMEHEFEIALEVQVSRELISAILWYGSSCEVLSPQSLREAVKKEVEALSKRLK
jgi:predicted DNA-binding transcriptional regulator YafY